MNGSARKSAWLVEIGRFLSLPRSGWFWAALGVCFLVLGGIGARPWSLVLGTIYLGLGLLRLTAIDSRVVGPVLEVRQRRQFWSRRKVPIIRIVSVDIPHPFVTHPGPTVTLPGGEVVPLWVNRDRARELAAEIGARIVEGPAPPRQSGMPS